MSRAARILLDWVLPVVLGAAGAAVTIAWRLLVHSVLPLPF